MRPRFSLRLFLIAFTLVAVALGVWTFIATTKEHIRRHKDAVEKLQRKGFFLPGANPDAKPTQYEALARRWIDPSAFSPSSGAISTSQFFAIADVDDDSARYKAEDIEEILTIMRDIYNVPGVYLCVDRLTVKSCRLSARHPRLSSLYLDCREIEPGATRELASLRNLTTFSISSAIDDDAISLLRSQTNLQGALLNISKLSQAHASSLPKTLKSLVFKSGGAKTSPYVKALANQPELTALTLYDCDIDRETAAALAALTKLETLELDGASAISADLWTNLALAKNLKSLDLAASCRLIEPFNREIANCPKLEVLRLEPVIFEPDDLNAFASHPTLKKLRFQGEIPESQIEAFLRKTPQCSVGMQQLEPAKSNPEKTRASSAKFYRLVNDKLEVSNEPFL